MKLSAQVLTVLLLAIVLNACGQGEGTSSTTADDMPRKAAVDSSKVEKMLVGADGQLVYRNDYTFTKKGYRVPYLDYDELCLKDGEEILTTGKYADITPDGKIDWANKDGREFYKEADAREMKMEDLVTLNDKPFRLPCKFADLGEEYAVFDKIDFSLMTDANLFPFTITDTQTGASLTAISNEFLDKWGGQEDLKLINQDSELIVSVHVQLEKGEIVKVSSGVVHEISLMKIKAGEIQIGSTLNEAYEQLGTPWHHHGGIHMTNFLNRDGDQTYNVHFVSDKEIYDQGYSGKPTKGTNVITKISVSLHQEVKHGN
ncbi:MAG: hypothetical protein Q4A72_04735 [Bacillota bacterium]|nr:hypothetical protein [Bacillota bacterium]